VNLSQLEKFLANPEIDIPILRLPQVVVEYLQVKTDIVIFSVASAKKNLGHHPDLTLDDYYKLSEMETSVDMVVQDGETSIVLIRKEQIIYWAAIKATKTRESLFLTSFRRSHEQDIQRVLRKGKVIYEKGG
jgi:hypothetical protein